MSGIHVPGQQQVVITTDPNLPAVVNNTAILNLAKDFFLACDGFADVVVPAEPHGLKSSRPATATEIRDRMADSCVTAFAFWDCFVATGQERENAAKVASPAILS